MDKHTNICLIGVPEEDQVTSVRSLGWEDPLEKGKATHPVFWPGEFHGLYRVRDFEKKSLTKGQRIYLK